jgi:hypothetical protein
MNASRSAVVILSIFVTISRACPPQKILRSPDSNRLASTGIPDAGGLVFLSGEEEAAIVTGEGRARCQPEGGHTGQ